MANVHRLGLMGWPFEITPDLAKWFERVAARPSYRSALTDWQPPERADHFAEYRL